jgi:hypothetical protein
MEDPELDPDLRRLMAGDLPPASRAYEGIRDAQNDFRHARAGSLRHGRWLAVMSLVALAIALTVGILVFHG